MRKRIKKFSDGLVLQISADEEEQEILQYGLHHSFIIIMDFLSILICGIFWNELVFSLLLFLCLFLLRPYAGGYHADTENRCYLISVGIVNLAIVGVKYINLPVGWMLLLYLCSFGVIWKNAPLENPINPLETAEKQKYSRKAKQILIGYSLIAGIGINFQNDMLYNPVFYGILIAAISILAGKYKYY